MLHTLVTLSAAALGEQQSFGGNGDVPQVHPKGTHFLLTDAFKVLNSAVSEQVFLLAAIRSLDCLSIPTVCLQFSNLESFHFKFVDSHVVEMCKSLWTNY